MRSLDPAEEARRNLGLPIRSVPRAGGSYDGGDMDRWSVGESTYVLDGAGNLTVWSWGAIVLSTLVAVGHPRALEVAESSHGWKLTSFAIGALCFAGAHVWLPWVAGITAAALLGLACFTRGLTRATRHQVIAMTVADTTAFLLALPLAIATVCAILLIVFWMVLIILIIVVGVALTATFLRTLWK